MKKEPVVKCARRTRVPELTEGIPGKQQNLGALIIGNALRRFFRHFHDLLVSTELKIEPDCAEEGHRFPIAAFRGFKRLGEKLERPFFVAELCREGGGFDSGLRSDGGRT